jgi:GNAT superfamily N-acetyltransferase
MTAALVPVKPEAFAACIDFLTSREYRCVSLMSHLVVDGKPSFPGKSVAEFVSLSGNGEKQNIDGILLLTNTGILFHCLAENIDTTAYGTAIGYFLARSRIYCIIGDKTGSCFLESLNRISPSTAVDYQLMTLDTIPTIEQCTLPQKAEHPGPELSIVKGTTSDADRVYPLQKGYELEEVVPAGGIFNSDACKANLLLSLGRQYIYLVKSENSYIAKAGTNARGLYWDQIGGVYTDPGWRGRGIASALVGTTARERMLEGRKIALFVKTTNIYAEKTYKKAGFLVKNLFRLSYYTYN